MSQTQRERLLSRPRPSTTYRLLVDADELQAAQEALTGAQLAQRQTNARTKPGSAARRKADKVVEEARAAIDACYETILLRALPTDGDVTVERLIAAHPPTGDDLAEAKAERDKAIARGEEPPAWPDWSSATFRPALLAACGENDMSEDDWRAFLASNVSNGEKVAIWRAVIAVNERERVADSMVLPKGLMEIINSRSN